MILNLSKVNVGIVEFEIHVDDIFSFLSNDEFWNVGMEQE